MRIIVIIILMISFWSISNSQDAYTQQRKLLESAENEIKELKNELELQRSRIAKLSLQGRETNLDLTDAIMRWNFATKKLNEKSNQLNELKHQFSIVENDLRTSSENEKRLTRKLSEVDAKLKEEQEYRKYLSRELEKKSKTNVLNDAIRRSNEDFHKGKSSSKVGFFEKRKPLLFINGGYRLNKGIMLNTIFGVVLNTDKNIIIGLGSSYDYYRNIDASVVSGYLHMKFSLGGTFIDDYSSEELSDESYVYVYSSFGFMKTVENSNALKGGVLYDIGAGYPLYLSPNMSLDINIGYSRQNVKELKNGVFDDNIFHTFDAGVGLLIYLGR